jgi:hypothetical protein
MNCPGSSFLVSDKEITEDLLFKKPKDYSQAHVHIHKIFYSVHVQSHVVSIIYIWKFNFWAWSYLLQIFCFFLQIGWLEMFNFISMFVCNYPCLLLSEWSDDNSSLLKALFPRCHKDNNNIYYADIFSFQ